MRVDVPELPASRPRSSSAHVSRTRGATSTSVPAASAGRPACLRQGSMSGETNAPTSSTVGPGEHDIARERREVVEEARTQRSDADPGAGREFEILGDAAIEQQALFRRRGIGELQRVADLIESFFIEGGAREVLGAPVAGRDGGPAGARFKFSFTREQFQFEI